VISFVKKAAIFALAGLLLYLALRGMAWQDFVAPLRRMDPLWVAAAVALHFANMVLRGIRWGMLLAPIGGTSAIGFAAGMVGYLGNTFLPARAGEVLRIGLVARRLEAPVGFVTGTAAAERIGDAVAVSLLAFVLVQGIDGTPLWLMGAATLFGGAGIALLTTLIFLDKVEHLIMPPLRRLPVVGRFVPRVEAILTDVAHGAQALAGSRARAARYVALTALIWTIDGGVMVLLSQAFAATLSLPQALLLITAIALSSAVPSTPGGLGVLQFVAVAVLASFGFDQTIALALIVVWQGQMAMQFLVWGTLGWLWLAGRRGRLGLPQP
jgi:glycosyltransferase 2 family protein